MMVVVVGELVVGGGDRWQQQWSGGEGCVITASDITSYCYYHTVCGILK